MKKKIVRNVLILLVLAAFSSFAQYSSGWKYVQNVKMLYPGTGSRAYVALSNTIGGAATIVLDIRPENDRYILELISEFQRAQNYNLKIAFLNDSRNDTYVVPGNSITLDVVR